MRKLLLCFVSISFFAIGCSGGSGGNPGGGGTTETPTPTPTPIPPGGGGTVIIGDVGLCDQGDVARVDISTAGTVRFPLVLTTDLCSPAHDNRVEEYTLMLYNTTASSISFRIDSPISAIAPSAHIVTRSMVSGENLEDPPLNPPHSNYKYKTGKTASSVKAANFKKQLGTRLKDSYHKNRTRVTRALGVGEEGEFKVRCDASNDDRFCTTSSILRAQGTHINIFVDRDVPFGADDTECIAKTLGRDADCLRQAQLDSIVTTFDSNIYPLETKLLGAPSDVDGDGRINVVITPFLNRDLFSDSYTDSRNVLPWDPTSNAGSNESENIFIFAPDSLENYAGSVGGGYRNIDAANFAGKPVNAWIAFQFTKIISFNEHVMVNVDTPPEEDWIDDGLGTVMADFAGFNIWRPGVYLHLKRPQLDDLRQSEDLDQQDNEGAEYLFMLYLIESQLNSSFTNDGDGFDTNLAFLETLIQSATTGTENIEAAVDFAFDDTIETEFQSIFKDWAIATATSGSSAAALALQQSGQTAVKYYLNTNPSTRLGPNICDASGSTRTGATGNDIGIDLNGYNAESGFLLENADEHSYAPGNTFFGYVDPFSVMFVRVGGMFQARQTIAIKASSSSLQGFILSRTGTGAGVLQYPKVYSESIFGSIDQHAEDLDIAGPNPYWTGPLAKKVDLQSLIDSTADQDRSTDYLTIVGQIDKTSSLRVCPDTAETIPEDCPATDIPDTDKYTFTVPTFGGGAARGDEGYLAIEFRRQFDSGSDSAALTPILAIVSSKDVPYPYAPHPIRSAIVGGSNTRQQYRWLTSTYQCGDDDVGAQGTDLGDTCTSTLVSGVDGNTDILNMPPTYITNAEPRNDTITPDLTGGSGGIDGGDCNGTPVDPFSSGGGYGSNFDYPITSAETSPSSMGGYSFAGGSFMELNLQNLFPDVLFDREVMKPATGYPEVGDGLVVPPYDPRSINTNTLNCQVATTSDPDTSADSPDDFLSPNELKKPSSMAEQILTEMSRGREDPSGNPESTVFAGNQYDDFDIFAIDGDSLDSETVCHNADAGNNGGAYTVRSNEDAVIWGNATYLEPHIAGNLEASANKANNPFLYNRPGTDPIFSGTYGRTAILTPGKNYTIIVGGIGSTQGNYEIRIRKYNPNEFYFGKIVDPNDSVICRSHP